MANNIVKPNKVYILTEDFFGYKAGDYFKGLEGNQLQHVRTEQIVPFMSTIVPKMFATDDDFDENIHGKHAFDNMIDSMEKCKKYSDDEILVKIDRNLKRKQRRLIIAGIVALIFFAAKPKKKEEQS